MKLFKELIVGTPINLFLCLLILLTFFLHGCSAIIQPADKQAQYMQQIIDWQKRIQEEGWNESLIRKIIKDCVWISKYVTEEGDHWQTPLEFINNDFQGDCEDFASFQWGTLKKLGCPYPVRMAGVATAWPTDHAVLRVQLPTGWKTFESVPVPGCELDGLFYRVFVEWDEASVYLK